MQYQADRGYYAKQPFGAQPPYFQQFPPGGYPYGQPVQPIAQPYPVYAGSMQPGTPAPGRPRPLDREASRSSTPGRYKPLKSALKRTRTPEYGASVPEVPPPRPASRGRPTDANGMHRVRTRSGSRMRAFDAGTCSVCVCPRPGRVVHASSRSHHPHLTINKRAVVGKRAP